MRVPSAVARRFGCDRGMATAELAAALPVLLLLVFVGLAAVRVADAKLRCVDAAREAARAVARGDAGSAAGLARGAAGARAVVRTTTSPGRARVTVTLDLRPVPWLAAVTVSDTAEVALEPSPSPSP